jgi:hypothetical protein
MMKRLLALSRNAAGYLFFWSSLKGKEMSEKRVGRVAE